MELDCTIAGVSQDMSLGENVTTTFLVIRLPNGSHIRAAIDDAAAAAVVGLSVAQSGPPRSAMRTPSAALDPPPPPQDTAYISRDDAAPELVPMPQAWPEESMRGKAEDDDNAPRIFGGQDGGDEPSPDYAEPPPPLAPSPVQKLRNGRVVAPQKKVPMDGYGYPVVQSSGVDPATLTSRNNQDEDGVGSV
jgi:hypothetical protein